MDFPHLTQKLPRFAVAGASAERVTGMFEDRVRPQDGWIGYLFTSIGVSLQGRFRELGIAPQTASFVPLDDEFTNVPAAGMTLYYIDGYWGERVATVLDRSLAWHLSQVSDDHEHCFNCWQAIGSGEAGYRANEHVWSCRTCYDTYVVTRTFGFMDEAALAQLRGAA
jgi:ribosomal protein L37AE/L43A